MPFIPVDQLSPRSLEWLWTGRLPLGHLVLLDGDPGVGKSILTLDLCARLTAGLPFPDGVPAVPAANVLILNAEDSARELIRPRLLAAGADLRRVTVWHRHPGEPCLRLPGDLGQLDAALARLRPCLIVLDPLTAFLDSRLNLASEHDARNCLFPLADLAAKHDCAALLIRHLSKNPGARALYRGLHSIAFVAACRLAWFAGRDPSRPHRFVLAEQKSNLDLPRTSLAYAITTHPSGHARIDWHGPLPWTADDLLGDSRRDRRRARAAQLLATMLRDGPRLASDVHQAAHRLGISSRTLRRAYRDLDIDSQMVGILPNHRYWLLLPGQELPDSVQSPQDKQIQKMLRNLCRPPHADP